MKIKIETDESLEYDEQVENMDFHLDTDFGDADCIDDLDNEELTSLLSLLGAIEDKINGLLEEDEEAENEEEY